MACGQAVGSAVKANVKGCLAIVDQVDDLFIGDLGHQAAGLEFFVQSHKNFLLFVGQRENKTPSAKINLAEGDKIRGTTSVCRLFTETASRVRTPE